MEVRDIPSPPALICRHARTQSSMLAEGRSLISLEEDEEDEDEEDEEDEERSISSEEEEKSMSLEESSIWQEEHSISALAMKERRSTMTTMLRMLLKNCIVDVLKFRKLLLLLLLLE